MSRRHRARAQRTRDRPRASSRAPPSRMNPRLERDDRPRERINTRRRHARARRSIETDRVAVSRAVRPRMRARDDPRRITRRRESSSIERSSPPASSRRERTHKDKKKTRKKTDDASRRRTNDRCPSTSSSSRTTTTTIPARGLRRTHPDRPTACVRPTARPTDRAINRPSDRPTASFFLFFSPSVRRAPIARVRACAREKIESRPTARSMTSA